MSAYCVTGKFMCWDEDTGECIYNIGNDHEFSFYVYTTDVTDKMEAYKAIRHRLSEIKKVDYDNMYFYEFNFTLHENFFGGTEHYDIDETISLKERDP